MHVMMIFAAHLLHVVPKKSALPNNVNSGKNLDINQTPTSVNAKPITEMITNIQKDFADFASSLLRTARNTNLMDNIQLTIIPTTKPHAVAIHNASKDHAAPEKGNVGNNTPSSNQKTI